VLAGLGFFTTFMVIIDRFSPFPSNVSLFSTVESLVGLTTLIILVLLNLTAKKVERADVQFYDDNFGAFWQFMLTFFLL